MTNAPNRVVAVTSSKSVAGYPYKVAAVYELKARKADGVQTYRRSDANHATPHRSEKLAQADARELSEHLGIPLWSHVRHGMTADDAINYSPDTIRRRHAEHQDRIERIRIEASNAITAPLRGKKGTWRVSVIVNPVSETVLSIEVLERTGLGTWMGNVYRSSDPVAEALAALGLSS